MKIFISWSGDKSKAVAIALREWLPCIFQTVSPWMSATDIGAGERWSKELSKNLNDTSFGILCITKENLRAPWLLFEAGALSKSLIGSRIVPYLIDITPKQLTESPISQFQAISADKEGTKSLLEAIIEANESDKRPMNVFEKVFKTFWPELEKKLSNLPIIPNSPIIQPPVTNDNFIQSDGILWKLEDIGGMQKYSPYCPDCTKKLRRTVDFVDCQNCGFSEIVSARQPTKKT